MVSLVLARYSNLFNRPQPGFLCDGAMTVKPVSDAPTGDPIAPTSDKFQRESRLNPSPSQHPETEPKGQLRDEGHYCERPVEDTQPGSDECDHDSGDPPT